MAVISLACPPDGQNASAVAVAAALSLRDGDTLRFSGGVYHFYEDGAYRAPFCPANNTSGEKRVALPLLSRKHITVDGGGSVFVFHGMTSPVVISGCEHVTVRDCVFDTAAPSVATATVREKNPDGVILTLDRAVSPWHTDAAGHLILSRDGKPISTADGRLSLHALERVNIKYLFAGDCPASRENLAVPFLSTDAVDLGGNTLFLRYRPGEGIACPYEVGETFVINLEEARERSVFFLENSRDVTLSDITVRRGGGMGVIAQMCENLTLRRLRTDRTVHQNRITLTADAIHCVHCSGAVTVEACEMESFLDDAMNVHGVYTVLQAQEENRLTVRLSHEQQDRLVPYCPGDRIRLLDPESLAILGEATVTEATLCETDDYAVRLTVADRVGEAPRGALVENPGRMPSVTVRDCRFSDYPHIRLSGAGDILVERCAFTRSMSALVFLDLAKFWYESGRLGTVTVRNNTFTDACILGGGAAVTVGVSGYSDADAPPVHDTVTVEQNRFLGNCGEKVHAAGVRHLHVR